MNLDGRGNVVHREGIGDDAMLHMHQPFKNNPVMCMIRGVGLGFA